MTGPWPCGCACSRSTGWFTSQTKGMTFSGEIDDSITVKDATDQLNSTGDEYLPREIDGFSEKKVAADGDLLGGRT